MEIRALPGLSPRSWRDTSGTAHCVGVHAVPGVVWWASPWMHNDKDNGNGMWEQDKKNT